MKNSIIANNGSVQNVQYQFLSRIAVIGYNILLENNLDKIYCSVFPPNNLKSISFKKYYIGGTGSLFSFHIFLNFRKINQIKEEIIRALQVEWLIKHPPQSMLKREKHEFLTPICNVSVCEVNSGYQFKFSNLQQKLLQVTKYCLNMVVLHHFQLNTIINDNINIDIPNNTRESE